MTKPLILSDEEIQQRLDDLPGWEYADNKISKQFKCENFLQAFRFIEKLVPFVEAQDHHPDIHWLYNKITFELQRFDVGGRVTDKDFLVAQEIERLYTSPR